MRSMPLRDVSLPTPVPDRLRDALLAAAEDFRWSADALRDAVCEHVADARRRGMPVEDVAAELRSLVAEMRDRGEISAVAAGAEDRLLAQLVAWCREFGAGR